MDVLPENSVEVFSSVHIVLFVEMIRSISVGDGMDVTLFIGVADELKCNKINTSGEHN